MSGSDDWDVKLWDVQTGGVVKTFCGHTDLVTSVSISSDCITIASGSPDRTIRLWHVQAGDCFCVIDGFKVSVRTVSFSPTNPQLLMSASGGTVQQWDINGCQIGPTYEDNGVAFSLDGTHFISWGRKVATIRNSGSRGVVAELQVSSDEFECCCFSQNGRFVAGGAGDTIYIWDITGSDPHLIETLIGHSDSINSLIFPASIISASKDDTIKFWQTGAPSTDPVAMNAASAPPSPSAIMSVSLQVKDGVAISSDEAGVVKTWDILTGLCKASFQTPAEGGTWRDVQLIEGRLIVVWFEDTKVNIWDDQKGKLHEVNTESEIWGIRISGDGSKVFHLTSESIQAWSVQTGEAVGRVALEGVSYLDPLCVDGSKIWVCFKDSSIQGWDFGIPGSSPIQLSNKIPDRPHLDFIDKSLIKDTVTGKEVFKLVGRYARPEEVQWDGQYLVAGYWSGEVLILDSNHVLLH